MCFLCQRRCCLFRELWATPETAEVVTSWTTTPLWQSPAHMIWNGIYDLERNQPQYTFWWLIESKHSLELWFGVGSFTLLSVTAHCRLVVQMTRWVYTAGDRQAQLTRHCIFHQSTLFVSHSVSACRYVSEESLEVEVWSSPSKHHHHQKERHHHRRSDHNHQRRKGEREGETAESEDTLLGTAFLSLRGLLSSDSVRWYRLNCIHAIFLCWLYEFPPHLFLSWWPVEGVQCSRREKTVWVVRGWLLRWRSLWLR